METVAALGQSLALKDHSSLEGRFELMVHDGLDGRVNEQPVLLFDDRSWIELAFEGEVPRDRLKERVSVTGELEAGRFSVFDFAELPSKRLDADPIVGFDIIQTDQRVAVLLISFQGNESPFDPNEMKDAVFGTGRSASEFYQEGSRGLVKLIGVEDPTGDVFPVSVSLSGCTPDYAAVGDQARQVAEAQGVSISSYDKIVYYLPPNASNCPGGGVGGGDSAFIFGVGINGAWDYVAHEVGHAFGLPHAGSYTNCTTGDSPVVYGGSCAHDEYGDLTDIMGGRNFMYSSFLQETLGWLPAENVLVLEESARVVLAPINISSSTIQSLRIPRDGGNGATAAYHVEFRQPTGFDSGLEQGLTNGVLIRLTVSDPLRAQTTHILDMTPGSTNQDMIDAALAEGRGYQDDNLLIEVVEVTSETATIDVTLDAVPPDPDTPVGVGGTNGGGGSSAEDTTTGGSSTTSVGGSGGMNTGGMGGNTSGADGSVSVTSASAAVGAGGATASAASGVTTAAVGGSSATTSPTGTTTATGEVTPGLDDPPAKAGDEGGCGCRLGAGESPRLPVFGSVLMLGVLAFRRPYRRCQTRRC